MNFCHVKAFDYFFCKKDCVKIFYSRKFKCPHVVCTSLWIIYEKRQVMLTWNNIKWVKVLWKFFDYFFIFPQASAESMRKSETIFKHPVHAKTARDHCPFHKNAKFDLCVRKIPIVMCIHKSSRIYDV